MPDQDVINTNLENKKKLLTVFFKMIEQQTIEGAKKYGQTEEKEWTDSLSDIFGLDYFFMNIMKYIGRIRRNDPRAEVDHAKIGTYTFLRWVKKYGRKHLEELAAQEEAAKTPININIPQEPLDK